MLVEKLAKCGDKFAIRYPEITKPEKMILLGYDAILLQPSYLAGAVVRVLRMRLLDFEETSSS